MRIPALQPPGARGQSLVVFAICLLLLTLMVTMSLSFGTMAKEKMEVQEVADQAAYSQAVAVARTFNELAIYNRAQLGQMVAILGVQSALSFAGLWRAYVTALMNEYYAIGSQLARACSAGPGPGCQGPDACAAANDVWENRFKLLYDARVRSADATWGTGEYERVGQVWQPLDSAAGDQVRSIQGYAAALFAAQTQAFDQVLINDNLDGSKLARALLARAAAGSQEWAVVDERVTLREVKNVVLSGGPNLHAVRAAMGSRGHPFVTRRLGGAATLTQAMAAVLRVPNEAPISEPRYAGSSYYGPIGPPGHSNTVARANQAYAWGDDHFASGSLNYRAPSPLCNRSRPFALSAHVKSTDRDETTDDHVWEPSLIAGLRNEGDPPTERHTTAPCRVSLPAGGWASCVSVWVTFMDYDPAKVANKGDAFGQPKTFAALKRDYSTRAFADPWNLAFKFRFAAGSSGAAFALRGSKADPRPGSNRIVLTDGTDISVQSTVSTGIAYYHRMNHWKEPPNLFNPFWRAGLVHADVDGTGEADFRSQVSQAAPWAADAFFELRSQGWAGIP